MGGYNYIECFYWGVAGLLKLGLRSTFTHIAEQLQRFVELVNM